MEKNNGTTAGEGVIRKAKKVFVDGPVSPVFIGESIAKHSRLKNIGAHGIFLGQVRNDLKDGREVIAIEYSSYREMAEKKFNEIREDAFSKYPLTCMHIYHSLGRVNAGEISLFVFVSAVHRKEAIDACSEIVERIKKEVPVWGKEMFDEDDYTWKTDNLT